MAVLTDSAAATLAAAAMLLSLFSWRLSSYCYSKRFSVGSFAWLFWDRLASGSLLPFTRSVGLLSPLFLSHAFLPSCTAAAAMLHS